MFASYLHTLRESVHRRMALVLIGMAFLVAILIIHYVPMTRSADGESWQSVGLFRSGKAQPVVLSALATEVRMTGGLWLFLAIFASVPLLISTLEKGWVELTFTKGVPRWRVLLGSYLGGLTLYGATLCVAILPPALWWGVKTGAGIKPLWGAILLQVLAFGALLALASLASLTRTGVAIPIMLAVLVDILSPFLANREQTFFLLIASDWGRGLVTWVYRILPKNFELVTMCQDYIHFNMNKPLPLWPIWSTGAFTVATLGLTIWLLHRKSL
jgi:hypothetical protein